MKKNLYILIVSFSLLLSCNKDWESASSATNSGKNGSLSRMITIGNYIYAVDDKNLITISSIDPSKLLVTDRKQLGNQIQTIFYNNGSLYIGAANNMYTYDISIAPDKPAMKSSFTYPIFIERRDPILAFDSVLYSTAILNNWTGELRIFNNKDITNPQLVSTQFISRPRGMDRVDTILYLCNGTSGLNLFSIKKPYNPVFLKSIDEEKVATNSLINANDYFDVLAIPPLLFCYTSGSLIAYNINNPSQPSFLNKVK